MNHFPLNKYCQLIISTKSGTSLEASISFLVSHVFCWHRLRVAVLSTSWPLTSFLLVLFLRVVLSFPRRAFTLSSHACWLKDMASNIRLPVLRLLHYYKLCDLGCVIWLLLLACRHWYDTRRVAYNRRLLYTKKKNEAPCKVAFKLKTWIL